ncbi:hypothetical protein RJ641_003113 [Dillenia turbinata]|uniref:C2H2-type domain-containing protein n=1 Tax=Dillenia turbinata TaxID=194707 RepID=A0AAN8ZDX3_9MAGN
MAEEDQKLKRVCKLCNKRFPSGKSLGGHMRHHVLVMSSSSKSEDKACKPQKAKKFPSSVDVCEEEENEGFENEKSVYGLRKNPRKTWRFVDSTFDLYEKQVCEQCGKGFDSLRALFGHMKSHSLNNKRGFENLKGDADDLCVYEEVPTSILRRKRSRKERNKNFDVYASNSTNGSEAVSGIEQEQEVAKCLMMLSRDPRNGECFVNSVEESSVDDSVVLEAKSLSPVVGVVKKEVLDVAFNGDDEGVETNRAGEIVQLEKFDGGYSENGGNKVKSDVSANGFSRNGEFNNGKTDDECEVKLSNAELRNCLERSVNAGKTELGVDNGCGLETFSVEFGERNGKHSYNLESYGSSIDRTMHDLLNVEQFGNGRKESLYECLNRDQSFGLREAHGGQRISNISYNGCNAARYNGNSDLSVDGGESIDLNSYKGHGDSVDFLDSPRGQSNLTGVSQSGDGLVIQQSRLMGFRMGSAYMELKQQNCPQVMSIRLKPTDLQG